MEAAHVMGALTEHSVEVLPFRREIVGDYLPENRVNMHVKVMDVGVNDGQAGLLGDVRLRGRFQLDCHDGSPLNR